MTIGRLVCCVALMSVAVTAQDRGPHGACAMGCEERPLPEQEAFLLETKKHLQTDSALQSSYMYIETRREQKLDKRGRITDESRTVIENYPGFPGEPRWERVIEENGKPVPASKLEAQNRERQRKAEEYARRMASEPKKEYARQLREWEKYRDEAAERVDDIFRVFDIRMLGREPIAGHGTIAFALTPRPAPSGVEGRDARPRTREGGMMRRFTVRAWISETDHELVRLDAEAIDDLPFAWGLLARLHKGARLSFERRKINNEVWLPAAVSYQGNARVGLLAVIRRAGTSEYSSYRKFAVDTSTVYTTPERP